MMSQSVPEWLPVNLQPEAGAGQQQSCQVSTCRIEMQSCVGKLRVPPSWTLLLGGRRFRRSAPAVI